MSKIFTSILLLITWPWLLAGLDATYYAVMGSWLTSIPWHTNRGFFLLMGYPIGLSTAGLLISLIWINVQ